MAEEIQNTISELLKLFVGSIVPDFSFEFNKEGDQWRVIIDCESKNLLIEDNAVVLKSIQHLLRVLINKKFPNEKIHFLLDVGNFRKQRELKISKIIPEIAQKEVLNLGKTLILTGLSGYERMLVHKVLSGTTGLNTTSVGPDTTRKLLIMPTSEFGSMSMEDAVIVDINKYSI